MKLHYLLSALLILCFASFFHAQSFNLPWKLENQVPQADIYSINRVNNDLHVSSGNKSYSNLNGSGWVSSAAIGVLAFGFNDITFYNGKLYGAAFMDGVYTSTDMGLNWSPANTGLSGISSVEFTVWNNVLYVASENNGVYKLDASGTQWQPFNNGLSAGGWGVGFNCLAGSGNGIIGSVNSNGYVVYFEDTSNTWKGAALKGTIAPGLQTFDIVNTGSQLWALTNNKAFASTDKGLTWSAASAGMKNGNGSRGLQVGTTLYVTVNYLSDCYLYKRDLLQPFNAAWTMLDTLKGLEAYGLSCVQNKLYVATTQGLYYLDPGGGTTGLEEQNNNGLFSFSPNPASDQLTITVPGSLYPASFSICDSQGRKIVSSVLQSSKQTLDVSGLPAGLYFADLFSGGSVQRKKLVIAR